MYLRVVWSIARLSARDPDLDLTSVRGPRIRQKKPHTVLGLDVLVDEEVDSEDDDIAENVHSTDSVQPGGILKRDSLRDLHHS